MEDETPSGFFPEIVKFLENLPDGVGKTRLCSLLSRGDVADLINLRTAAGSVQGRDIKSFVRLVIQKRTAGRGAGVLPFLRFVIPFLTEERSCHSPRSQRLYAFSWRPGGISRDQDLVQAGPSGSLLGDTSVSADFFSGAERSGDLAVPQEQAIAAKELLSLLRASVLPSGERIAVDEPAELHAAALPDDLRQRFPQA